MPGDFCDLINAYCAGVNAWVDIAIRQRKLPVEFMLLDILPSRGKIRDSLGWGKMMAWTLAANWQSELYRRMLLEKLGPDKVAELEIDIDQEWGVVLDLGLAMGGRKISEAFRPYTRPGLEEGVGSNNWVLHGSRTVTGKPLLANDMHLELTTPGIWFENHLKGGELGRDRRELPGGSYGDRRP